MNGEIAVETQSLSKRFGDFPAVTDVNLRVSSQRITGFLGRNGAGKSSTIKMLLGMIAPTSGSGQVLGLRIDDRQDSIAIRRQIAYVGEDKGLYPYMTVKQLIGFAKSFYADWRPEEEQRLLRQFDLPLGRKVKALSKGMRTKLALLLALTRCPALLVLDEPTEGLDPVLIEELLQLLIGRSSEGTTILFSSHQLAEVERIADDVVIIDHGQIVLDSSLDDLRQHYRSVSAAFTTELPEPEAVFRLPGVERVRANGRQVVVLANRSADAVVQRARSLGASSIEVAAVTLRDVFLDKVMTQQ